MKRVMIDALENYNEFTSEEGWKIFNSIIQKYYTVSEGE